MVKEEIIRRLAGVDLVMSLPLAVEVLVPLDLELLSQTTGLELQLVVMRVLAGMHLTPQYLNTLN